MKITISLLLVVSATSTLLSSLPAFAECKQANFRSTDGSQISIHYSSNNQTDGSTAWVNPTIHVVLSNEKCSAAQVVVQLVSSQFGFSSSHPQTLTRDGENACTFAAATGSVEIANHGGALGQQIAVQLIYSGGGSEWLDDPITFSHNFSYVYQNAGYSPNAEDCR